MGHGPNATRAPAEKDGMGKDAWNKINIKNLFVPRTLVDMAPTRSDASVCGERGGAVALLDCRRRHRFERQFDLQTVGNSTEAAADIQVMGNSQGPRLNYGDPGCVLWPGFLSRDGVHPSRLGNKVLVDFLHREACALSTHLEKRRIQQSYKESKASAWSGWARQEHFAINLEVDFPALGMHAVQYSPAGLVSGAGRQAAPGGEIITPHRFRSFISKKGNHRFFRRSCQEFGTDVVSEEMPDDNEVLSLGGQDPRHGEEEASAGKSAVSQAVGQCGDSEWKLVQSKKSRRKATALHKQEQSSKLCADSEGKVLAVTAAMSIRSTSPMTAVVSQKQIQSASSAVWGRKPEGRASVSHKVIRDSFKKVHRVPSKQLKDCSVSSATHCESVTNDAVNEISVCKSHLPALTRDCMRIERDPGTEAGDPMEPGCTEAVQYKYCEAALTS
ncbi:hypothetical protein HPB51_005739 [Rhipicephalus microplus]|uniref:DIX domain-containing protein n=1 Tax=Rhipicephalus microplus TaxID=6941 RepID=A0A9J6E032_RHIMP|nr:hypothetical protein HPB51_005739 [Rhipicephalus microplus]